MYQWAARDLFGWGRGLIVPSLVLWVAPLVFQQPGLCCRLHLVRVAYVRVMARESAGWVEPELGEAWVVTLISGRLQGRLWCQAWLPMGSPLAGRIINAAAAEI